MIKVLQVALRKRLIRLTRAMGGVIMCVDALVVMDIQCKADFCAFLLIFAYLTSALAWLPIVSLCSTGS